MFVFVCKCAEQLPCVVLSKIRFHVASDAFWGKLCAVKVYLFRVLLTQLCYCSCLGDTFKMKAFETIDCCLFAPVFSTNFLYC